MWVDATPGLGLDRGLLGHLAVLKCWVDANGLSGPTASWRIVPGAGPLDVGGWLGPRRAKDFDDEDIGLLTTPPPDLDTLGVSLAERYRWLEGLPQADRRIAAGDPGDRGFVLECLAGLADHRLPSGTVW